MVYIRLLAQMKKEDLFHLMLCWMGKLLLIDKKPIQGLWVALNSRCNQVFQTVAWQLSDRIPSNSRQCWRARLLHGHFQFVI